MVIGVDSRNEGWDIAGADVGALAVLVSCEASAAGALTTRLAAAYRNI